MHLPDGFIGDPINAICAAIAVAGIGLALNRVRGSLSEQQAPLLGMTAAFVFAAQMLNFPIGAGTSGHFLGAAFATALLGPWGAGLVLALVLIVQCLLFADGGFTALGTNIVNMGLVGVIVPWLVLGAGRLILPRTRGASLATMAVAAWLSVLAASAACALQLGASGQPLGPVLAAMLGVHAVIGVGEALITVALVSSVLAARPELLPGLRPAEAAA